MSKTKTKDKISNGVAILIGSIAAMASTYLPFLDELERESAREKDDKATHLGLYASEVASGAAYREQRLKLMEREIHAREAHNRHLERLADGLSKAAQALTDIGTHLRYAPQRGA